MMAGKLSAEEIAHIKVCREELYPDPELDDSRLRAINDVGRLLEHIEAVEAERSELIESADALTDEQDARIRLLKQTLEKIKQETRLSSDEATLATAISRLLRIWDLVEAATAQEEVFFSDGDPCQHCGSTNTERIDTISDDPVIWVCQCGSCGKTFEVLVEVLNRNDG